jgi:hypothetical protein
MFHLRIVLITSLFACGCSASLDRETPSWDEGIGASKDDLVKKLGVPTRCHTFKSAGEACEWPVGSPSQPGTITVQFDAVGNACQWTYRDHFGDMRSRRQCS